MHAVQPQLWRRPAALQTHSGGAAGAQTSKREPQRWPAGSWRAKLPRHGPGGGAATTAGPSAPRAPICWSQPVSPTLTACVAGARPHPHGQADGVPRTQLRAFGQRQQRMSATHQTQHGRCADVVGPERTTACAGASKLSIQRWLHTARPFADKSPATTHGWPPWRPTCARHAIVWTTATALLLQKPSSHDDKPVATCQTHGVAGAPQMHGVTLHKTSTPWRTPARARDGNGTRPSIAAKRGESAARRTLR